MKHRPQSAGVGTAMLCVSDPAKRVPCLVHRTFRSPATRCRASVRGRSSRDSPATLNLGRGGGVEGRDPPETRAFSGQVTRASLRTERGSRHDRRATVRASRTPRRGVKRPVYKGAGRSASGSAIRHYRLTTQELVCGGGGMIVHQRPLGWCERRNHTADRGTERAQVSARVDKSTWSTAARRLIRKRVGGVAPSAARVLYATDRGAGRESCTRRKPSSAGGIRTSRRPRRGGGISPDRHRPGASARRAATGIFYVLLGDVRSAGTRGRRS